MEEKSEENEGYDWLVEEANDDNTIVDFQCRE